MAQVEQSERRNCPRLKSHSVVRIGSLAVKTTNISLTGIQISCPAMLLDDLLRVLDRQPVEVTLTFPDQMAAKAVCNVSYLEDYGSEYLAGLKFKAFEADGFEVLKSKCSYYGAQKTAVA